MPVIVGLNSGTSADGVDAIAVRFDGEMPRLPVEILACVHRPYPAPVREALETLFTDWRSPLDRLCSLSVEIGEALAGAAAEVLSEAGLRGDEVDVCGSHGQTIFHIPPALAESRGLAVSTWQIGEAAIIADRIGCPVASDFRAADIAAGGQGAPLTPILDHRLFTDPARVRIRLNIGGIANLTWLPPSARGHDVIAFDTGPGNTLIDQAVSALTSGREMLDRDGVRARRGRVDESLLAEMLTDRHFAQSPPKSTGREHFNAAWLERFAGRGLSGDDLIATVTALTPASIAHAIEHHLPPGACPDELILHGGGARNPAIVEGLRRRLPATTRLTTVEEFGIGVQALEPLLFALLGWLCLRREPVHCPGATGAQRPALLGKMSWP